MVIIMSCIDKYSPKFNERCLFCKSSNFVKCKNDRFNNIKSLMNCLNVAPCDNCDDFKFCDLIERLITKNYTLGRKIDELENKIDGYDEIIENAITKKRDDIDLKSKVERLEDDLDSLDGKVRDLDDKVDDIERNIDTINSNETDNNDNLETRIKKLDDEIENIKKSNV
jgi:DNA repair exonuclease SbcCD ATPase subunit